MTETTRRTQILKVLGETYPTAVTELLYHNPFQLLIAVVMSAQTTDRAVNAVTSRLFTQIETPEDIIALGYDALAHHIKTIGLWQSKARNIVSLSETLITRYNSSVPSTRQDLMGLAGVGPKTAAVVLNVVYNEPTVAVDTHVFRVSRRTGLAVGAHPRAIEEYFYAHYTPMQRELLHHRLILHGRYVCTARKPQCVSCVLKTLCPTFGVA